MLRPKLTAHSRWATIAGKVQEFTTEKPNVDLGTPFLQKIQRDQAQPLAAIEMSTFLQIQITL
jgi:hypothetical protein